MSKPLYDEVLTKGFTPQLEFKNDSHLKILHLLNTNGKNVRVSVIGKANKPSFTLTQQNPSFKSIEGGVRVHLGHSATA